MPALSLLPFTTIETIATFSVYLFFDDLVEVVLHRGMCTQYVLRVT